MNSKLSVYQRDVTLVLWKVLRHHQYPGIQGSIEPGFVQLHISSLSEPTSWIVLIYAKPRGVDSLRESFSTIQANTTSASRSSTYYTRVHPPPLIGRICWHGNLYVDCIVYASWVIRNKYKWALQKALLLKSSRRSNISRKSKESRYEAWPALVFIKPHPLDALSHALSPYLSSSLLRNSIEAKQAP